MALKGNAEQSQRNAAGRLDSRYVRWGRPKVRVDSCRRLNAECLYGRWIDLNQQTNDLCALKALKESCENCVAACLPARLLNWQSSLHFHWPRVNRVGKSFFETQVQFISGARWPQSDLGWRWQQRQLINSRLLRNYQLPILTHINQQIAVLWAKAEINWAKDTNGYRNRRNRTETHKNSHNSRPCRRLPEQSLAVLRLPRTRHRVDFITHNGGIDFVTYYLLLPQWQQQQQQRQLPQWLGLVLVRRLLRQARGRLTALVCCIFCAKWKSMAWPCFPCETRVVCWTWTATIAEGGRCGVGVNAWELVLVAASSVPRILVAPCSRTAAKLCKNLKSRQVGGGCTSGRSYTSAGSICPNA